MSAHVSQVTVHGVEAISVEYTEVEGSKWITIRLGDDVTVTAFVERPIVIEGADLLALMAHGSKA